MDVHISVPSGHESEKRYVLDFFFGELLGLKLFIEQSPGALLYEARLGSKKFQWPDIFFRGLEREGDYPQARHLPTKIGFSEYPGYRHDPPLVFYGEPSVLRRGDALVEFGYDLPAMVFFGLSRWEEALPGERDSHGRFPAERSFAFRQGILERPWINEQAIFFAHVLETVGLLIEPPDRYELVPTHDVDNLDWYTWKELAGDILTGRDRRGGFGRMRAKLFDRRAPLEVFDFLMDESEAAGLRSRFYCMAEGGSALDGRYSLSDPAFKKTADAIRSRGHVIGFHPGFLTFDDRAEWAAQKLRLEAVLKAPVTEGRQHYLMYDPMKTWSIQDACGFELDSTLGYASAPGFRCGTGSEFFCFDLSTRRRLRLRERPLIAMEGSFAQYLKLDALQALARIRSLMRRARTFKTPFTLLFHNTSLDPIAWPGWRSMYSSILADARNSA